MDFHTKIRIPFFSILASDDADAVVSAWNDKAVIMAHVQTCDKNPLVQKLREISTEHQEALLDLDELRKACMELIMAIAHDMRNEDDEDFEPLLALKKAMMEVNKLVKDKSE